MTDERGDPAGGESLKSELARVKLQALKIGAEFHIVFIADAFGNYTSRGESRSSEYPDYWFEKELRSFIEASALPYDDWDSRKKVEFLMGLIKDNTLRGEIKAAAVKELGDFHLDELGPERAKELLTALANPVNYPLASVIKDTLYSRKNKDGLYDELLKVKDSVWFVNKYFITLAKLDKVRAAKDIKEIHIANSKLSYSERKSFYIYSLEEVFRELEPEAAEDLADALIDVFGEDYQKELIKKYKRMVRKDYSESELFEKIDFAFQRKAEKVVGGTALGDARDAVKLLGERKVSVNKLIPVVQKMMEIKGVNWLGEAGIQAIAEVGGKPAEAFLRACSVKCAAPFDAESLAGLKKMGVTFDAARVKLEKGVIADIETGLTDDNRSKFEQACKMAGRLEMYIAAEKIATALDKIEARYYFGDENGIIAAIEALSKLGDSTYIPVLQKVVDTSDSIVVKVRTAARKAIIELQNVKPIDEQFGMTPAE